MSLKTLPILFINLGGEMMYILDQRLRAQNIPDEKARKVIQDIVSTMLNKRFMEEIFKPQTLYSKKAMRTVFDRLAHASIMRLNAASMDKLYDLMTMAFKYQVSMCLRPKDILLITFNHMDAIRRFVEGVPSLNQQVELIYRMLIETYASLSDGEFQLIRQTLLNFFQDMHIRVSIFLKEKVQTNTGHFVLPTGGPVPAGCEPPGVIRLFNQDGQVTTKSFSSGASFTQAQPEGAFGLRGNRVTTLGTNMYSASKSVETISAQSGKAASQPSDIDSATPNPLAKAHLDLLSQLIGANVTNTKTEFRLNLFKNDEEESQAAVIQPVAAAESPVVQIDASKKAKNEELSKIMGELKVKDTGSGDQDLLDLMDSA